MRFVIFLLIIGVKSLVGQVSIGHPEFFTISIDRFSDDTGFEYLASNWHWNEGKMRRYEAHFEHIDSFLLSLLNTLHDLPREKNDILFFIHGMWGSTGKSLYGTLDELKMSYQDPPHSTIGKIVAIRWPANDYSYKDNKKVALQISTDVADMMTYLMRRLQTLNFMSAHGEIQSHLICHSLGNHFFEQIVAELDSEQDSYLLFDEIILAAPDLESDDFENGKILTRLQHLGNRTHIYFSEGDLTLKMSESLNGNDRLGLHGVSQNTYLPDNISIIDVSRVADERALMLRLGKHHYYRQSPTVCQDILQVFNGCLSHDIKNRKKVNRRNHYTLVN